MLTVATVLAVVGVVATLLGLVRSPVWFIRVWDFPRAQVAVLLLLAVAGLAAAGLGSTPHQVLAGVAAACLLLHLVRIYPYLSVAPNEGLDANNGPGVLSLRVLTANVLMENRRADDFVRLVRREQPDLLLVVEVDDWWDRQLEVLAEEYPYQVRQPLENTYGMSLYSRLELGEVEVTHLVEPDVPSIFARVSLPSGPTVQMVGVHPRPPEPTHDTDERDAELVMVGKFARDCPLPVIVAGDLNDVAWSHTTRLFRRISGLIDPRIGRGFYNTFHAKIPLIRFPIDHVFYDRAFLLRRIARLPAGGSDHFPVLVELAYRPRLGEQQKPPLPHPADEAEVLHRVEKVGKTLLRV